MIIAVDLDDTLCKGTMPWPKDPEKNQPKVTRFFETCSPILEAISKVNKMFDEGHTIIIWTSRRPDDYKTTFDWLYNNKVKFHDLILHKLRVDVYIDNQSVTMREVLRNDSVIFRGHG
jgi:hypothetical protein